MCNGTFAKHQITKVSDTGSLREDYRVPFSALQYSRFKYGSKSAAREFGYELASGFLESTLFWSLVPQLKEQQGIIYPSPYNFIPTATKAMQDYFLHRFNAVAVNEFGIKPLREGKVHRAHSYQQDYALMNKEERDAAISGDDFWMETANLQDQVLLFMDDIRVTGSHEQRMRTMVANHNVTNPHCYLYFAEVAADNLDPRLENYLNMAAVNGLLDINGIIQNDKFLFNTRVTKYMLSAPQTAFRSFIQYQSTIFQTTLLSYATGNGYYDQPEFRESYQFLYSICDHPVLTPA